MTRILAALAFASLSVSCLQAQTKAVTKTISTNALTEDLVIPAGKTITNHGTAVGFGGDWSSITGKPTTLAGYGITDPIVLTSTSYSNPAWITALAWSKISSTPTTLAGYGITDPIVLTSTSYSNPTWITALAWSKISSTPTTLAGYGIADGITAAAAAAAYQPLNSGLTDLSEIAMDAWGIDLLTQASAVELRAYAELGDLATLNAVGSAQITDGTIVNADISASAAIAVAKISGLGTLATLNAVASAQITDDTIVNADINASAAIAISKIDGLQDILNAKASTVHTHSISAVTGLATNQLFGTGGTFTTGQGISVSSPLSLSAGALSLATGDRGDITVSSGGTTWSIDSGVVTDAMLAGSITPSKITGTAAVLSGNTFTGTNTVRALAAAADDSYDIGTSFPGARFRNGEFSGRLNATYLQIGPGQSYIYPVVFGGVTGFRFTDAGGTNAAALMLGPADASHPAITADGADLTVRLGDNSGAAKVKAKTLNLSNVPTSSAGLSSGDVWNDSGTLKIVP